MASTGNDGDSAFQSLESLAYAAILDWLDAALSERIALSPAAIDETPEEPILRAETRLPPRVRNDIRTACLTLIRRFVRQPSVSDRYLRALLRLAKALDAREAITDLHNLAAAPGKIGELPVGQQCAVLSALVDLKARLPLSFWQELAARHPATLGVLALSGSLQGGEITGLRIIRLLPDSPEIADTVFVVLDQHAADLGFRGREALMDGLRSMEKLLGNHLAAALSEVIAIHGSPAPSPTRHPAMATLDAALASFAALRNEIYSPIPRSPRLIP